MRTNIDIDEKLLRRAMRASGKKTKKDTVVHGLELILRLQAQEDLRKLHGKLKWEGDLEAMRLDE